MKKRGVGCQVRVTTPSANHQAKMLSLPLMSTNWSFTQKKVYSDHLGVGGQVSYLMSFLRDGSKMVIGWWSLWLLRKAIEGCWQRGGAYSSNHPPQSVPLPGEAMWLPFQTLRGQNFYRAALLPKSIFPDRIPPPLGGRQPFGAVLD